ncbi:MAG: hypothetical protein DWQ06_00765 [Calditrichaeota bacterium]|nr:MAG: hypothetical protein DWQ06_00765 [Calditrichota bacterium]
MIKTGLKTKLKSFIEDRQKEKIEDFGHLNPSLWNLKLADGELRTNNFSFSEIEKSYGSPLFIVDETKVRENAKIFLNEFQKQIPEIETFFSYKTNSVPGMLKIFHSEGFGAEVTSEYELWLAQKLGVKPEKIIFDGRAKSVASLENAVNSQIRLINIDTFEEIERLKSVTEKLGKSIDVGIRIQTGEGWKGQFGFSIAKNEAFEAVKKISETKNLNFIALHFHLGTLIKRLSKYTVALDSAFSFAVSLKEKLGLEVKIFDIGGGYGVPTVKQVLNSEQELSDRIGVPVFPPQDVNFPSYKDFANAIGEKNRELSNKFSFAPKFFCEPGRIVASSAQSLLLKVVEIKERSDSPTIAIMNGGMNIASPLRGEYKEAFAVNKMEETERINYKIVGPTCNPGDTLYPAKFFPKLNVGDLVLVVDAGAYFTSYSNSFCFPKPAIIVVNDKKHYLSRKAETFDYINQNDLEF